MHEFDGGALFHVVLSLCCSTFAFVSSPPNVLCPLQSTSGLLIPAYSFAVRVSKYTNQVR